MVVLHMARQSLQCVLSYVFFQVITSEEAERRGQQYDSTGITYLFDLDYESDEFTVDAARYGNVSHFVNHSVSGIIFIKCSKFKIKLFFVHSTHIVRLSVMVIFLLHVLKSNIWHCCMLSYSVLFSYIGILSISVL